MSGSPRVRRKAGISDLLTCKLCGSRVTYLGQHLKLVHNMTGKEYKHQFPGERLTGNKQIITQQKRYQDDSERVSCQICGQSFLQITAKHLQFHGTTLAQYMERYPDSPLKTEKVKQTWSQKARWHVLKQHKDPAFKESLRRGIAKVAHLGRERHRELLQDPEYVKQLALQGRKPYYHYYSRYGEVVGLRSKGEIAFAYWADSLGETWYYEPEAFAYQHEGRQRFYVPDFYVPVIDSYVEVKSSYLHNRNRKSIEAKISALPKPCYIMTEHMFWLLGLKPLVRWINWKVVKHDTIHYQRIQQEAPQPCVPGLSNLTAYTQSTM